MCPRNHSNVYKGTTRQQFFYQVLIQTLRVNVRLVNSKKIKKLIFNLRQIYSPSEFLKLEF